MEILVFGLTLSLIYGLIVAGFALILGASRIFDLCFGSYYLLAGYSYFVWYGVVGKVPALFLSIFIAVIVAWLIHRHILFRFRETPIVVMVVSASLAIAISEAVTLFFGSDYKYVPPLLEGSVTIFGASIANQRLLAGFVALLALSLLWLYLNRSAHPTGGDSGASRGKAEEHSSNCGVHWRSVRGVGEYYGCPYLYSDPSYMA
jgi:branched-subunit amino acid ABC-type transport system permease component